MEPVRRLKFAGQGFEKLEHKHDEHTHTQAHTQTDRQADVTECITTPHLPVVTTQTRDQ